MKTLNERVADYRWYATIELPGGIKTPGHIPFAEQNQWESECLDRWVDMRGKRVLDIGCRDGYFCVYANRRGASDIVGIDIDVSKGLKELIIPELKLNAKVEAASVYDLEESRFGMFDVVLFFGVLYHLRFPFWALYKATGVVKPGGLIVVESGMMVSQDERPLLWCPTDDSPYEPTSCTFFNRSGLVKTMRSFNCEHLNASSWHKYQAPTTERQLHVFRRMDGKRIHTDSALPMEKYWTRVLGESEDWQSSIKEK